MDEIFAEASQRLAQSKGAYSDWYSLIEDDHLFIGGDQWTAEARHQRAGKPLITINLMERYVHRLVNPVRQSVPGIKIIPRTKTESNVRQELVRQIEAESDADSQYIRALENAVVGGLGWLVVGSDYADGEGFRQRITITAPIDPRKIWLDPGSVEPDGSDADFGFVECEYPRGKASELWDGVEDGEGKVSVLQYYRKVYRRKDQLLLEDGRIVWGDDIRDAEGNMRPEFSDAVIKQIRKVNRTSVECYWFVDGNEIDRSELETEFIPLIPVYGVRYWDGERWLYHGIVHGLKDSARMVNWYASVEAELAAQAPRAPWVLTAKQIEGKEKYWAKANMSNLAYLVYNPDPAAPPPQRADNRPQTEAAIASRMRAMDDIAEQVGLFGMGQATVEESGRAVLLRQRQQEEATSHFVSNLSFAIRQAGRVVNQLIGTIYPPGQAVVVRSEDGVEKMETMPDMGASYDWSVTVDSGRSYRSQREEAQEALLTLMTGNAKVAEVATDVVIEQMDWPGAKDIAERVRKSLPPELTGEVPPTDPQAEQAMAQAMQTIEQQEEYIRTLEGAIGQLQAQVISDREKVQAQLIKAEMDNATKIAVEEIKQGGESTRQTQELIAKAIESEAMALPEIPAVQRRPTPLAAGPMLPEVSGSSETVSQSEAP